MSTKPGQAHTRGAVITLRYDEANSGGSGHPGLLTSVSSPHDQNNNVTDTAHYHYDALDRVDSVTDPLGRATTMAYNGRHQLKTVTHPDAAHTHVDYAYDPYGNRTSKTDELGHTWSWTYDEHRRPRSMTQPVDQNQAARVTTYNYDRTTTDANGNPVTVASAASSTKRGKARVTFPSGKKIKRVYEPNGWLAAVVLDPDNVGGLRSRTNYSYNKVGQVETTTQVQLNRTTTSTHDTRNRLLSVTDNAGHVTTYAYYPSNSPYAGNLQSVTRPDGRVITYSQYDNLNRPTVMLPPDGNGEVTNYSLGGDPVDIRDRRNRHYTYTFDLLGRRKQLLFPDSSHEDYTYDAAGNLASYLNRAGATQTYRAYDARNRPTGYDWNDGGLTPGVTVVYDDASRLTQLNNAGANLGYTYTPAGELLTETEAIAGVNPQTIGYHPDVDGVNAGMDYPSGYSLALDRDAREQVYHLGLYPTGQPGSGLLEGFYNYYADGSLSQRQLSNQTWTTYQEDAIGRVTETDNYATAGGATHQDITHRKYGHLSDGQMSWFKKLSDPTLPGSATENDTGDAYFYDDVDRLHFAYHESANVDTAPDAHGDSGANNTPGTPARYHVLDYDASGNRTQTNDNGTTTTYPTVNDLNQYTSLTIGGTTYPLGYDGQGNLASGGGWTYSHDAQSRLRQAAVAGTTVTFLRDAKGRVVRKTVNGVGQDYYYQGWSLIEERPTSAPTTLGRLYVYGAGSGAPTASLDGPAMGANSGRRLYYHFDARGYVTHVTDNSAAVVEQYLYDAFGQTHFLNPQGQEITGSAVGNRFTFAGQQWLTELGLYDLRNRYYHPSIGRFLEADPTRFGGGDRNLYAYCSNDPSNRVDPSGLEEEDDRPVLWDRDGSGGSPGGAGPGDRPSTGSSIPGQNAVGALSIIPGASFSYGTSDFTDQGDGGVDGGSLMYAQNEEEPPPEVEVERSLSEEEQNVVEEEGQITQGRPNTFLGRLRELLFPTARPIVDIQAENVKFLEKVASEHDELPQIDDQSGFYTIIFKTEHALPHFEDTDMSQADIETQIESAIRSQIDRTPIPLVSGSFGGTIDFQGTKIQYRGRGFPNNTIFIGTYFPVGKK